MATIIPFVPRGVFDDATTNRLGAAFDAASSRLATVKQHDAVRDLVAKRIIAAALEGERSVRRLRNAGLQGLRAD
jgi:hypothetical protein